MGIFGTFLTGALTGIVGLGIASWAYSSFCGNQKSDEADEQEDE